jgi:hypothetical protein
MLRGGGKSLNRKERREKGKTRKIREEKRKRRKRMNIIAFCGKYKQS